MVLRVGLLLLAVLTPGSAPCPFTFGTTSSRSDPGSFGGEIQTTGTSWGTSSLSSHCPSADGGFGRTDPVGPHCWDNLNDGKYGDAHSWINNNKGIDMDE